MCAVLIACLIPWTAEQGVQAGPQRAGNVAIKRTEPTRVVFLTHAGPYWQSGATFARVRAYMLKRQLAGPTFARYRESPMTAATASLPAQIGFMVDGEHEPNPPLESQCWESELVAYMIIEGRSATTREDYAALHDWIKRHGHEPAGPVTEIYQEFASRSATGIQRTEIQVVLRSSIPTASPIASPVAIEQQETAAAGDAPNDTARTDTPTASEAALTGEQADRDTVNDFGNEAVGEAAVTTEVVT